MFRSTSRVLARVVSAGRFKHSFAIARSCSVACFGVMSASVGSSVSTATVASATSAEVERRPTRASTPLPSVRSSSCRGSMT
jgi:hypothetical protein